MLKLDKDMQDALYNLLKDGDSDFIIAIHPKNTDKALVQVGTHSLTNLLALDYSIKHAIQRKFGEDLTNMLKDFEGSDEDE